MLNEVSASRSRRSDELKEGEVMHTVIAIIFGVVWAVSAYKLAVNKGRKSFAPFAAILGFLTGLIGLAIVACVPSTPEARKLRAQAKAAKAGPTSRGLQVPLGLHEEHNLPPGHSDLPSI